MQPQNPNKPLKNNPPGKSTYGPAMRACTPFQRKFIEATFEHPDLGSRQIIRMLGYKYGDEAIRKLAWRLNSNELVKAAMLEVGSNKYRSKLPKVISAIEHIIDDPKARDRVKVLHGLLDRIGMHAITEHKVTHAYDRDSVIARIASVLDRNQQLIGHTLETPVVTDGSHLITTVQIVDDPESDS